MNALLQKKGEYRLEEKLVASVIVIRFLLKESLIS